MERSISLLYLVHFDARILGNNPGTTAWSIQENAIKSTHDGGELTAIIVANNSILDTHTVNIGNERLATFLVGVIGKQEAGILHELS